MRPSGRRFIHMGINYLLMPAVEISKEAGHRFYGALISAGIDFTTFSPEEHQIKIRRDGPPPLEVLVGSHATPVQPLGQLLILAPNPNQPLANFATEAQTVINAFDETWPSQNRQVISCDVALRYLYPSTSEHAFQEIWETRLCQPANLRELLGRPVWGGGLRFVMPPQSTDPEPTRVEIKIESYLKDTKMLFIEAQFAWPTPRPSGTPLNPSDRLQQADDYVTTHVHSFMESAS